MNFPLCHPSLETMHGDKQVAMFTLELTFGLYPSQKRTIPA